MKIDKVGLAEAQTLLKLNKLQAGDGIYSRFLRESLAIIYQTSLITKEVPED